jgi:thiamine-monophosphate kinase
VALGAEIAAVAAAAIDVSDGLVADLGHICEESRVAAEVERDALPLSVPARTAVAANPALWTDIFAGGDDYEILFTAPPGASNSLPGVSRIGRIVAGQGVRIRDVKGQVIEVQVAGYRHF